MFDPSDPFDLDAVITAESVLDGRSRVEISHASGELQELLRSQNAIESDIEAEEEAEQEVKG